MIGEMEQQWKKNTTEEMAGVRGADDGMALRVTG